ncbi:MAG: 50S ribosomal protein L22 [Candidatus Calescibacterium sp.]|nr:50S ribosomal protein L22 [Candidatus Calescibacterium sp.]MCX7734717.1 50S ribosomal protein L22 [bacterium]MDW8087301.1 50S ribosomal protein L22 [Candidatus Calescibacterium sp.]
MNFEADSYAVLRYARVSPKKVLMVVDSIKGKKALEALDMLKMVRKKAARFLEKVLRSAIANAEHNFKIPADQLFVKTVLIGRGPYIKRWKPSAYGRALPIRRKTTHITVLLERRI